MNKKEYLAKIVNEFENWWSNDPHSLYIDFYKEVITFSHLNSLSDENFLDFFYNFVKEGGKVQSGGERTKNIFKNMVKNDLYKFKKFVLRPFQNNFSLKEWFDELNEYSGFGIGIATIFLNRVNYNKYPIMNNKTLNALNKLGYEISSTKNWKNYELVKKYQDDLINNFSIFQNYFKVDALNHFIVAVYQGKELLLQIENFNNEIEQHEISYIMDTNLNKEELLKKITQQENDKSEKITINGKTYKRYNYLMEHIKKYRDYKCQFCSTTILKANGSYYIEACHIKAKADGGSDTLDNILILCPNCHKLFDYGKRDSEKRSKNLYTVTLNKKTYKASLK